MALEAPGGFRFVWGSSPGGPVHLLAGDAPDNAPALCGLPAGWPLGVGWRDWPHADGLYPQGRALCGGCGERLRALEKAGRLLDTPPSEQLRLF